MSEIVIEQTVVRLVQGDITREKVDAVVNAANTELMGGGGVDGAIHRAGGPAILAECRRIRETKYPNGMPPGQAVITTGGKLPARHVVHTVGPVWHGGRVGESAVLAEAYTNSLRLAIENGLRTVAFPSISTGVYAYPIEQAAREALAAIAAFIRANPGRLDEVCVVLFSPRDLYVYESALADLTQA